MDQDGATFKALIMLLYPNDTKALIHSTKRLVPVLQTTKYGMTSVLVSAHIEAGKKPSARLLPSGFLGDHYTRS